MKLEALWRWLVPLGLSPLFLLTLPLWPTYVWLLVGMIVGLGLLWFDQYRGWRWYTEPEAVSPIPRLITRSPLFLVAYVPLAVFVVTSTGSVIGMGLVLALGWVIVVEMWQLRRFPTQFQHWFGQQVTHVFTPPEVQRLAVGSLVLMIVLTALALF